MIKVTLKTTLTTIQNRHHLSNGKRLLRGRQLHLEHHFVRDRFQVGPQLWPSLREGVLQDPLQPRQRGFVVRARERVRRVASYLRGATSLGFMAKACSQRSQPAQRSTCWA